MAQPTCYCCKALVWLTGVGLAIWSLPALAQGPKQPQWTHAHDLKARKSTEPVFTEKTQTFGIEVFRDDNNGDGVYLIETGNLGVVPNFKDVPAPVSRPQKPQWMHGLDLKVRKAGEQEFTANTQVISLEVFRDPNTGAWMYVTEKGALAVLPGAQNAQAPTSAPKTPQWVHGLDLKCRRAGEKDFGKDTHLYSIEVFRDENNGNLIYIAETGAIAVAPAGGAKSEGKAPDWMHGLDLKVRSAGEKDFTAKTQVHSLEVFRDNNNGNWIYLTDAGNLAVIPGNRSAPAPTAEPREPRWTHGLTLYSRKSGERDFTPKTRGFGIEVFRDENTGATLYLSETGAIAAVAAR
jgi:hypothetical protein